MRTIVQKEKECWVCRRRDQLHCDHIFYGRANRKVSEKYGMKVWLCYEHHTGPAGVHFNKGLDQRLKAYAQEIFEQTYDIPFAEVFGKNYKG